VQQRKTVPEESFAVSDEYHHGWRRASKRAQMALQSDLVRLSKLDARFTSDPHHTRFVSIISRSGQRKIQQEEEWKREKKLGEGAFGAVYLEQCTQGDKEGKVRAVKKIRKPQDTNYYRELEAVALFSHPKVSQALLVSGLKRALVLISVSNSTSDALSSLSAGMTLATTSLSPWSTSLMATSTSTLDDLYQKPRLSKLFLKFSKA
jgi:serine/threonine protein kinase